jgi:hypothetical protein
MQIVTPHAGEVFGEEPAIRASDDDMMVTIAARRTP